MKNMVSKDRTGWEIKTEKDFQGFGQTCLCLIACDVRTMFHRMNVLFQAFGRSCNVKEKEDSTHSIMAIQGLLMKINSHKE